MRFQLKFILLLWVALLIGCASKGESVLTLERPGSGGSEIGTQATDILVQTPVDQENASYLLLGAFANRQKAEQLKQRIAVIGVSSFIVQAAGLYQVKSGPYADADQALRHKQEIDQKLDIETRVVFE